MQCRNVPAYNQFRIDGWEGLPPELAGDASGELGEELPVILYLCPKCGKIEFKVDERPNQVGGKSSVTE